MITFTTIIVLPLLLTAVAFFIIGGYLVNWQHGSRLQDIDYTIVSESFQAAAETVDEIYNIIVEQVEEDVSRMEDIKYLENLEDTLPKSSAYYIIRKNEQILYTNNADAANMLLPDLPVYGEGDSSEGTGYYFTEKNKYVKQYDFRFGDGSPGTLFVIAKMNSLCDRDIIAAVYEASAAGVKIDLIVRGICCLKVGIPGVSENINVRSIVGNFLEHSRIFYFENDEHYEIYCCSADWMPRNLERRVEILFPVDKQELKEELLHILQVQLSDTAKAAMLTPEGTYEKVDRRGKKLILAGAFCTKISKPKSVFFVDRQPSTVDRQHTPPVFDHLPYLRGGVIFN